ncbi:MAG: hypothetical protein ORN29_01300 [Rhodoferax sp.]|nr:hypothetical protein [Rhodoferax sp.]
MANTAVIDQSETELIALPLEVANMLRTEAKKSRLSVAQCLRQWLEDIGAHTGARHAVAPHPSTGRAADLRSTLPKNLAARLPAYPLVWPC